MPVRRFTPLATPYKAGSGASWLQITLPDPNNSANLPFIEPAPIGNSFYRLRTS